MPTFNINNRIDHKNPSEHLDSRYGKYDSISDLLQGIPIEIRKPGRMGLVIDPDTKEQTIYHFYKGVTDDHLKRLHSKHFGIISSLDELPDDPIHGDRYVMSSGSDCKGGGIFFYDERFKSWLPEFEFSKNNSNSSGDSGTSEHNELEGLQGGSDPDYYHLTENQYNSLSEILYNEHMIDLSVTPLYGEKGVKTDVTFSFAITPNSDEIISVTDNNSNSYNTTSDSVTIQDVVATISRTFTVEYDKNEEVLNKSYTKTYNAYLPQWRGRHTRAEMNSYLDLSTYLGKVVQSSATIENIVMPTNQYIWFASKKSDAKIYDQNEFQQTIGSWGDGVSEFYTKPLTITLQDGTTATIYLYRTRLTKTIPSTFKYTIR